MSIVSDVLDCYDEGKASCPQCGTAPNACEEGWALCETCQIGWLRGVPSCEWLESEGIGGEERARREKCLNALRPGYTYADRSGGLPEWVKDVMERHYGIRPF